MNDKRVLQGLFITSVLVAAALSITFATADDPGTGNTIYVYADGSGDYPTIQQAIDNASDGDVIFLGDGIYRENILVNKSVDIVGESRGAVINGSGNVVNVTADGVNISWLTVRNGSNGIIVSSNNTMIFNCNISNNDIGINITGSSGSKVYHNNFINNVWNARDDGSNIWDNGYPSGGNYWDDYAGTDGNGDGIGDTPYAIPGGSSTDRYPFMAYVDLVPPSTSFTSNGTLGDNGWYVGNATVILSASDNSSNVNYTLYRIDSGQWAAYGGPFEISSEGSHKVEYYSVDTVGNMEDVESADVKIDKSLPSIECYLQPETPGGNDGWYTGNVEVTLSADDNASGVESIKYRIDQETWKDYTGYFLLTVEGNHTFTFHARDNAGHETEDSVYIKIDKTAPDVSVSYPAGGYIKGTVEIEWNASDNVDDDLNGSISIYAVRDSERMEIASGLNNTGTYEWNTLQFDDSSYVIEISATDEAGNNGTNTSQPFILDNSAPTIIIDQPKGGEVLGSGKNLVIFWNASDDVDSNLDGTIWISYSGDGGNTWDNILEGVANSGKYTYGISNWDNGNYMLRINATDDAGNTGWATSGNFTIDKTPPTVTIKRPESGYLYMNIAGREIIPPIPISLIPLPYNTIIVGKITVEISASDEFSDIDHIDIEAGGATKTLYGGGSYDFEWNTPLGKCDLSVVAYDMAGNSGEDELTDIFCINA